MKAIARSLVVVFVMLIAVPALAVSYAITNGIQLLATTALIMGGTEHSLSPTGDMDQFVNDYMADAVDHYIDPETGAPDATYAVTYPAEFFPVFGTTTFEDSVEAGRGNLGNCLDNTPSNCAYNNDPDVVSPDGEPPLPSAEQHFIVFGYSQSAVVASLVKNDLINNPETDPDLNGTEFFLIANPMRPNGGIEARGFEGLTIPILGIPFYGPTQNSCPTADPCAPDPQNPDDLVFPTTDIAQQYDFLGGDAPARLDALAFANSIAAYALLHGNVPARSLEEGAELENGEVNDPTIIYQGAYGDTDYYLITAPRLPLLMLLEQAGVPSPALALPDALLRVWMEDKYRRDLSPGEHVQFELIPIGNPVSLVGNMLGAIPVGIDDTVQQATGTALRPLGTADVYRPFGVGGTVYDKTTGEETTDSNVLPFNGAQSAVTPELQTNDTKLAKDQNADEVDNVTAEGNQAPEGTKPGPVRQLLRGPIEFDRPTAPSALRPNGDGPLKRIVSALTGQRPNTAAEAETGGDNPDPASNEPAT